MQIEEIEKILLEGNKKFQRKLQHGLETLKNEKIILKYPLLILTCMDPRIDVHRIFQLEPGDVFILRNAGNVIARDMLRSIFIAISEFNVKNLIVLGHLDCGMTKIKLLELKTKLEMNLTTHELRDFFKPFIDELVNISNQVRSLRNNRKISSKIQIAGMLYDVNTGYVFESRIIERFDFIEDFNKQYPRLIEQKKSIEFNDLIESKIENTIKNQHEDQPIELKNNNLTQEPKELVISEDFNYKGLPDQSIYAPAHLFQIEIPKIKMPKIYIPKINIRVPMLIKKKSQK
ncbi:MAG: beta-class carbonic anhydrase [Promethearchaeota archaeon]